MLKLFPILFGLLFAISIAPAHATWCQESDDYISPCSNNIIPNNWVKCGTFEQEFIWCNPHGIEKINPVDNTANVSAKKNYRFYTGLSLGFVTAVNGNLKVNYTNKTSSQVVPGSFQQSEFIVDTRSTTMQASFGIRLIENLRLDISYTHYSDINTPNSVRSAAGNLNGIDRYATFNMTGGDVSSNIVMLNTYYNLDRLTGRFMNNKLSPYIGAGIGLGINKISDYRIYSKSFFAKIEHSFSTYDGTADISASHSGGTKNNLVYMFEAGGSWEFSGGRMIMDVFGRWTYMGKVETNGDVLLNQTVWLDSAAAYKESIFYTDLRESGNLNAWDVGARLRFMF